MAKSLRSSSTKTNKTRLRANVFSKVEDARTERLSAKLMELASKPKEKTMEDADAQEANDSRADESQPDNKNTPLEAKMALDQPAEAGGISKRKARAGRVQKQSVKKSIVFPVGKKDYRPKRQVKKSHRQKR